MELKAALQQRRREWQRHIAPARRLLWGGGSLATVALLLWTARLGSTGARASAWAGGLGLLLAGGWAAWRSLRPRLGLVAWVREVLAPLQPREAPRALRAAKLAQDLAASSSLSAELAELHFERLATAPTIDSVRLAAKQRGVRLRVAATLVWGGLAVGLGLRGVQLLDGLNVLMAQDGRAPIPVHWFDRLQVFSDPPPYTGEPARMLLGRGPVTLPVGTELTVRARVRRSAPEFVLTDGTNQEPFVSDGAGGLVAHYTLRGDVALEVAGRFGDVIVPETGPFIIRAEPDRVPSVLLEQAPQIIALKDVSRIELSWQADDDYGVRQVELVLRSGRRQERRVLTRLEDPLRHAEGAHAIGADDLFLQSAFLPVEVSVEARDGSPGAGDRWGVSERLVIVPSALGQPLAERYRKLVAVRNSWLEVLAALLGEPSPSEVSPSGLGIPEFRVIPTEREESMDALASRITLGRGEAASALARLIDDPSFQGRSVASVRRFLQGQLRFVPEVLALGPEGVRGATRVVLALESALRRLSTEDARRLALRLGDVAEEARISAARAGRAEGQAESDLDNLTTSLAILAGGAEQMLELGWLGNDLGQVARAGLGRVRRAYELGDLLHTELAAAHLAARLRRPEPSFGAIGRPNQSGARGGSSEPSEDAEGEGDDEAGELDELAKQVASLATEHGGAVAQVQRALEQTERSSQAEEPDPELAARARELRDAVADFPEPGSSPGSSAAALALLREQAGAAASALERGALESAARSLEQSARVAQQAAPSVDEASRIGQALARARTELARQTKWVLERLSEEQARAASASQDAFEESGRQERELARAAARLAELGSKERSPLPEDAVQQLQRAQQFMEQAADELAAGRGRSALARQEEAQALLEMARPAESAELAPGDERSERDHPSSGDNRQGLSDDPSRSAEASRGNSSGEMSRREEELRDATAFRQRVLRGLGSTEGGELREAVRRYAEGLIR